MAYKVLYRKYRPDSFENLYGQENIKNILIESIKSNKISHAYLFHGPRGTGKTSTAKIFAKTINCEMNVDGLPCGKCRSCLNFNESNDIIEIDAASNNGVDEIRNLRDSAKILPTFSKYKIYIIDEVHMLSQSAWNAFLKTLEEPPSHVIFILATTELQKIPLTILSRCQRFSFRRLTNDIIADNLKRICSLEGINITADALDSICDLADGAMRDALSILDQLSKENINIDSDLVYNTFGLVGYDSIKLIFESLSNFDYNSINSIFDDYIQKGLNVNIFINKILSFILQLEIDILSGSSSYLSISDLKQLSSDISGCYGKRDSLLLIKIYLLSYIKNSNNGSYSSDFITKSTKNDETSKVINNTIIKNENEEFVNDIKLNENISNIENNQLFDDVNKTNFVDLDELIKIRINNSYVGASKSLKNDFINLWNSFVTDLEISNNVNLLNFVENLNVEVVSPTNVLFSNKSVSTTLLFNNNLDNIEGEFIKYSKRDLKFICLSTSEWEDEKLNYIKLLKSGDHVFTYINENEKSSDNKSLSSASDIFGDSLLEIK